MKAPRVAAAAAAALLLAAAGYAEEIFRTSGMIAWYPPEKDKLAGLVDSLLAEKPDQPVAGRPIAVIAPHAGYTYSGKCAGAAYSTLKGRSYDRVVAIGISHSVPFVGAAVLRADAYATPLGTIPVDRDACALLLKDKRFAELPRAFAQEHSLDNQVPFLQRALKGEFKIVPVLVGQADAGMLKEIAKQVKLVIDSTTLVVVSSDFTHYGPNYDYVPFRDKLKDNLKKLAGRAAEPILRLDADGFLNHVQETGDTICGRNSIAVLLYALPRGTKAALARYYTSGDLAGDYTTSVSYQSFVFTEADVMMISEKGQQALLAAARQTIEAAIAGKKLPALKIDAPELQLHQGAFVTITKDGDLRGCIGQFTADEPLFQVVSKMARASALEDPRFASNRLKLEDLAGAKIEISVLSPMKRIKDPLKEVKLGTHGIYIRRGFSAGTFLPQVATEYNMTLEEFLSSCCSHKAGLPEDAWKDPQTEVYIYSAQVFGEH